MEKTINLPDHIGRRVMFIDEQKWDRGETAIFEPGIVFAALIEDGEPVFWIENALGQLVRTKQCGLVTEESARDWFKSAPVEA